MVAATVFATLGALACLAASLWLYWRDMARRVALIGTIADTGRGAGITAAIPGDRFIQMGRRWAPVGERLRPLVREDGLIRWIRLSGLSGRLTVEDVLGMKAALVLGGLLVGVFLSVLGFTGVKTTILLAVGCFFGPDLWLRKGARDRQATLTRELPDFLDMMGTCLSAGIPLDPALRVVSRWQEGPLAEEIRELTHELDLGVTREESYRHLLERAESVELEVLVQALLQGLQLGVPVATTFTLQARDMRVRRSQSAREQAAKASPKITLIAAFVITPGVFLFIMALLVLNLMYNPNLMGIQGVLF